MYVLRLLIFIYTNELPAFSGRREQQGNVLIITPVTGRRQQIADELAAVLAEPTEGTEDFDDDEAMRFAIEQVKRYREEKKKNSPRGK